jgi:AraC-like DNA-binding protein
MAYRELPLPGRPAPHVACLWTRDAEPVASVRRILPDACVDVVWVQGDRLVVAGPATGPALAALPAGAAAAGVRFRVGAAGSAVGVPARELRDRNVDLADVWGARAAGRLTARLERAGTAAAAITALVAAVVGRLPPADELDPVVRAAALRSAAPRTAVERLAWDLGLGERQLRRRFDDAVGYGPKTLQRVLRFQRFLALAAQPGAAAGLAQLAFAAGYADQAHLTRECRRLSGLTPAALLATGAGAAGERSVALEAPRLLAA